MAHLNLPPLPELPLTELGKRIELLRVHRQIPKQRLAREAGTSRQQLWRVMTGKCDLTTPLRERLADVLAVSPSVLGGAGPEFAGLSAEAGPPAGLREYLASADCVERTLRTLPPGDDGRRLKRAFLNELEELALVTPDADSAALLELRRRVLHGEL